ncbi:MAG TPA: tetraacyldisaccharide 4'-kinase [Candidatus Cloacimonadota bacterium]|nr:tetraacyldisaccharide 4'-kinase [Candidatus Cloacimonadota bacterium]HPT72949.1 tetraacyldisaccharide 4'-kinase [Candidatus Cloacimonadota bacterium]
MDKQNIISKNLYQRSFLSYILLPLSLLNIAIQFSHRMIYRFFPSRIFFSPIPVISIGNIVSGGSGKTPFTVVMANYLTNAGKKVAVSHRDYKGQFETGNQFISDRQGILPELSYAGDEAALLAEKLPGIPVIAGRNRRKSIKMLAERYKDLDYIILDDSFQHLKVHHDKDFVIFNSKAGYGNGFVLPSGILREPLSSLQYTDFIVWNGNDPVPPRICSINKPIIQGTTQCTGLKDMSGNRFDLSMLKNKKLVLLSGIGYPLGFEDTIKSLGLQFPKHYALPDHYQYTDDRFLAELADAVSAGAFDFIITTEKDYVKLRKTGKNLPLLIVEIEFMPDEECFTLINELL